MQQKFLLKEFYSFQNENDLLDSILTEQERHLRDNGTMFLAGVVQRADSKNGNARRYPRRVLEREVENYKKLIRESRATGEADHPASDRVEIELKNVSHLVTDIWWEDDDVKAKIKLLDTPSGNIIKSLVREGVTIGISSRGLGSTKKDFNGNTIVEDDYQLICFDIVSEPSTQGAFMLPLREGVNYTQRAFPKADRINRILNSIITE